MTPQQNSSIRAYPFILAALAAALMGALYINAQARGMTAQEVFGVEMDFDDV